MDESLPVVRAVDGGTARLLPDVDRRRAWLLTVDDAPQSYVDLDDPTHLEFEYVRRIAHVLDHAAAPGVPLDVLHLGGGGLTLPRYLAATRPGSRQRVVDADRALLALVAEHLPLPETEGGGGLGGLGGITVRAQDARAALRDRPPGSLDVLVADVFGGSRVPAHLTTLSCAREAARALRPGGIYTANLADAAPFAFLRSQLATLTAVFDRLCLIAEPAVLRGRRFGNTVLVASRAELPLAELARAAAGDPFPARVVHGGELARITGDARPVQEADAESSPLPPGGAFTVG
ncbi:spermidine synthase-like protein [Streptomyces carminius]|uniref:Spermidine synthase-like protein n=1 Tax=Streptomyces carminius TaxID=2665496 RepID=A0A2M8MCN0_9ACTN|nr:fused MFS/spermidine synthase [Streptomyces carminius]PJE98081.1 spermidine synthase-like protein [Streptomyces carminius]PJF01906.1 spermidine synthase-like protein [Streptomyces carminius]